ncbi:hypothetical protein D3C80_1162820 [compost metagenome]
MKKIALIIVALAFPLMVHASENTKVKEKSEPREKPVKSVSHKGGWGVEIIEHPNRKACRKHVAKMKESESDRSHGCL